MTQICQDACWTPDMLMTLLSGAELRDKCWHCYHQDPDSRQQGGRVDRQVGAKHQQNQDSHHAFLTIHQRESQNNPGQQSCTPSWNNNIPCATLDSRLTWNSHIDKLQEKTIKKLAIMKKLVGTSWGANGKILRQIYTGTVRPITEYASTSWTTASKTSKS